jgi:glycosyltransferase involved in cell wall biosynthesis
LSRNMRICQFSTTALSSHYFSSLGLGLSASGATQVCGSLTERTPPPWFNDAEKVSYFCLDAPARHNYPRAALRLSRLLRRERIEILQTHLFDASVIGLVAARLARVPVTIVARHYLDEPFLIGTRAHVELDRWMARKATCVVVPSDAVRRHMIQREHLLGDNVEVIPYGFDFSHFAATDEDRRRVRAEFGFDSDFVIGCVGRFFKNKGHVYLIEALKDLAVEIPNVKLLLLGSGDQASIEEMAREHGVGDKIVFAGFRKDVSACMRAMDLLAHPSLSESFGQVLVEAMAVGTAVVATTVGGVPEIVTDTETGLLVPPTDAAAIARAVLELYRRPELRARLAVAGQTSVRERFTAEQMVSRYLDCYHRYLEQSFKGQKNYVEAQT